MTDDAKFAMTLFVGGLVGIVAMVAAVEFIVAAVDVWKLGQQLAILKETGIDPELVKELARLIAGAM
jgi:hypothetical protein